MTPSKPDPTAGEPADAAPGAPPADAPKPSPGGIVNFFRKRFLAGLITIIPAVITVWAVALLVSVVRDWFGPFLRPWLRRLAEMLAELDRLSGVPMNWDALVEPFTILLSLGAALLLIFLIGWLTRFLFFRRLIRFGERTVQRIPLIRFFYKTPKEVLRTITQTKGSFKRVVLIEYPRKEIWCIAFATGEMRLEPEGREMVTVFLPTTPNPTSGFLLVLPKEDVRDINLGVENGVRFIISAGILSPDAVHTAPFPGLHQSAELPPPPVLSVDLDSFPDQPLASGEENPRQN